MNRAILGVLIGLLFCALPASVLHADGSSGGSKRDWYISLEGGAEFDGGSGADSGWAALSTIGWQLTSHISIEAELGYRTGEPNQWTTEVTQVSLMANAVYETNLNNEVGLSIGLGVGEDKITQEYWWGYDLSEIELAAQLKFGVSIAVSEDVNLVANYRYMTTLQDTGIDNSTLTVGVRFDF